ncbi:IS200/IS605 family transposase [Ancylomarina sp. 16SWW S1-10-2]|uniref:IS200/IS605 family transposase n=1 Tax=Ancylomarina sp. 16SWW S1-10-2 TaxID=2499681 RepID=UPI0012AE28A2|nr:IS200/IS605 family transposase [Ancylomarina sp. 16SWW S1-10-2]MRT94797.1 IS200/IS605 family transposase [Ancylomarina sp. 16SWW S1-10-2]
MPQSLVKNYIHIVFSTKGRYPFIDEQIKSELFSYLAGICKNKESYPIVVGGHVDHIHILCLLSRKIALMNLVEELKSHSSKWIKTKGKQYDKFYWQNGYGGFSVKSSDVDVVTNYIQKQEDHHKKVSFTEEYVNFLNKYNIEYDERYVWD